MPPLFLPSMNKKVILAIRVFFGLMLLTFGSFTFMKLPVPDFYSAGAKAFLLALANTGYLNYAIGVVFIVVGLLFVIGRFVAFGALLLAPVIVNILLFHLFLDFKTLFPLPAVFALLNSFIAYTEWEKYKPLFVAR